MDCIFYSTFPSAQRVHKCSTVKAYSTLKYRCTSLHGFGRKELVYLLFFPRVTLVLIIHQVFTKKLMIILTFSRDCLEKIRSQYYGEWHFIISQNEKYQVCLGVLYYSIFLTHQLSIWGMCYTYLQPPAASQRLHAFFNGFFTQNTLVSTNIKN